MICLCAEITVKDLLL